jgi:tetratricopeptide (TPR) repeat protein
MVAKIGWVCAILSIIAAGLAVTYSTNKDVSKLEQAKVESENRIAIADQDWEKVLAISQEILKQDPNNKKAWFNTGLAQHYLGRYAQARESFNKSKSLGHEPGIIHYNLACGYAQEGKTKEAISELKTSQILDFPIDEFICTDPDLGKLKQTPEFKTAFPEIDVNKEMSSLPFATITVQNHLSILSA